MIHIAVGDVNAAENQVNEIKDLQQQFSNRPLWMAASIHRGEEEGKNSGTAPLADSWTNKMDFISLPVSCINNC